MSFGFVFLTVSLIKELLGLNFYSFFFLTETYRLLQEITDLSVNFFYLFFGVIIVFFVIFIPFFMLLCFITIRSLFDKHLVSRKIVFIVAFLYLLSANYYLETEHNLFNRMVDWAINNPFMREVAKFFIGIPVLGFFKLLFYGPRITRVFKKVYDDG